MIGRCVPQDTVPCPPGHGGVPQDTLHPVRFCHSRVTLIARPGPAFSIRMMPAASNRANALRFRLRSTPTSANSALGKVTVRLLQTHMRR